MSCLQVAELNISLLFPLFAAAPRKCLCSLACCSKDDAANPRLTPVSDETNHIHSHACSVELLNMLCQVISSEVRDTEKAS